MNTEQNQKVLLEQLEALKKENEQLKKELSILRNENISNRPLSFKEKICCQDSGLFAGYADCLQSERSRH